MITEAASDTVAVVRPVVSRLHLCDPTFEQGSWDSRRRTPAADVGTIPTNSVEFGKAAVINQRLSTRGRSNTRHLCSKLRVRTRATAGLASFPSDRASLVLRGCETHRARSSNVFQCKVYCGRRSGVKSDTQNFEKYAITVPARQLKLNSVPRIEGSRRLCCIVSPNFLSDRLRTSV